MACTHDLIERESELADGACPICMAAQITLLKRALQELLDDPLSDIRADMRAGMKRLISA